jgi:hypothetical protein
MIRLACTSLVNHTKKVVLDVTNRVSNCDIMFAEAEGPILKCLNIMLLCET